MRKIKRKTIALLLCFFIIGAVFPAFEEQEVTAASPFYTGIAQSNLDVTNYAEYATFEAAMNAMRNSDDENMVVLNSAENVIAAKKALAIIGYASSGGTHTFSSTNGGQSAYVREAITAFYNETVNASTVKITISGYTGTLPMSSVIIVPKAFISSGKYNFDYYYISGGDLKHALSYYNGWSNGTSYANITVDRAPSFMQSGVKYYSADGCTFYTDPYDVTDSSAVPAGRHYPYFKYLSYRSQTNYTAAEIDRYIAYTDSWDTRYSSILAGQGANLIKYQNLYGVNAVTELAFANLESAYGESGYALSRKNLFGIAAFDSNPDNATYFTSAGNCIYEHTKNYMNRGYLDAWAFIDSSKGTAYYDVSDRKVGYITNYSGDSRYYGSAPGNKNAGINVKYASDPFHGEKIAGLAYSADKYLGSKDYGKYTLGITKAGAYAYASANTSSWKLYRYSTKTTRSSSSASPGGMSVVILGETGNFYKIQSEMPVNKDLRAYCAWDYNFSTCVAYVLKSDITVLSNTPVDKTALNTLINSIDTDSIDRDIYTTESLATFDDAYDKAVKEAARNDSTQESINTAKTNLESAYAALTKITVSVKITSIDFNIVDTEITDSIDDIQISATINPDEATIKTLVWSSSDEAVATVDGSGLVKIIKNGSTKIKAMSKDGSGVYKEITLTVNLPRMTSGEFTIDEDNSVLKGIDITTTLPQLLAELAAPQGMSLEALDKDGKKTEADALTSGMSIVLYNAQGKKVQQLYVAVKGELNGDGKVDIGDFVLLRSVILGVGNVSGSYAAAADVTMDGKVDIGDFVRVRAILLANQ